MINVAGAHDEKVGAFVIQAVVPVELRLLLEVAEVRLGDLVSVLLALFDSVVVVSVSGLDLPLHEALVVHNQLKGDVVFLLLLLGCGAVGHVAITF